MVLRPKSLEVSASGSWPWPPCQGQTWGAVQRTRGWSLRTESPPDAPAYWPVMSAKAAWRPRAPYHFTLKAAITLTASQNAGKLAWAATGSVPSPGSGLEQVRNAWQFPLFIYPRACSSPTITSCCLYLLYLSPSIAIKNTFLFFSPFILSLNFSSWQNHLVTIVAYRHRVFAPWEAPHYLCQSIWSPRQTQGLGAVTCNLVLHKSKWKCRSLLRAHNQ